MLEWTTPPHTHTCENSRYPYSSHGSMSSTSTVVHVPSLHSRTWYAPSGQIERVIITRSTSSGRSANTANALRNLSAHTYTVCLTHYKCEDTLWILHSWLSKQPPVSYQQLPRSPCRISDGRGVRNTDHFTPRSLKLLQFISCGRSHFLIRCWTLSLSGKPTDLGPGGKLSSTKFTAFWNTWKMNILTERTWVSFCVLWAC